MEAPQEVRNVMMGNNIEEVRDFLERYQPIKIVNKWFPATLVTYENRFLNADDAFNAMRANSDKQTLTTIQLAELPDRHFAYMFYSH